MLLKPVRRVTASRSCRITWKMCTHVT